MVLWVVVHILILVHLGDAEGSRLGTGYAWKWDGRFCAHGLDH